MAYGNDLSRFLLLPELKLLKTSYHKRSIVFEVEKARKAFEICGRCASQSRISYGRRLVRVKDEPIRGRQIILVIKKRRYFCKPCKKPFVETIPGVWPKRRTTQRYRAALLYACQHFSNLSQVGRDFKCSPSLVYKVFYEQLELKLRMYQPPWPQAVGIDEHFFSRKSGFTEFTTVFADLRKSRLREAVHGKAKKSVLEQVSHIDGRSDVKWAVIDMSDTYRSLVRELFPNANIVADKFHVLRLLNGALIKERKNIAGFKQDLKTRRLLLTNRSKLDYFKRSDIDVYLRNKPLLKELYEFKERLHTLYRTKGTDRARRALDDLILIAKMSFSGEVQKLGRTLKNWRNEILNHFECGLTNARTEAFNNTGKLVQKRAYGYRSHKNYRLRLLSACLGSRKRNYQH